MMSRPVNAGCCWCFTANSQSLLAYQQLVKVGSNVLVALLSNRTTI